jgi:hypothetical protein
MMNTETKEMISFNSTSEKEAAIEAALNSKGVKCVVEREPFIGMFVKFTDEKATHSVEVTDKGYIVFWCSRYTNRVFKSDKQRSFVKAKLMNLVGEELFNAPVIKAN